jgi:tRNA(Ile)-lysidine synthase
MSHASSSLVGDVAHLAAQAGEDVLPPGGGGWAVGVSGGADSVALLSLLRSHRPDLRLHVAHLDHETRAGQSSEDAAFVAELSARWHLPVTVVRLSEIEPSIEHPSTNRAEHYREARLDLFRRVVARHQLDGVVLAHHADDQAETVLQRLLRGAPPAGLTGIAPRASLHGLLVVRPLLRVPATLLREYLVREGIGWREDATNAMPVSQRNRVRRLLRVSPKLTLSLIELADACEELTAQLRSASPRLPEIIPVAQLRDVPDPLARVAARRWLAERAGAGIEVPPAAAERLLEMARDAASPPRRHFPGRMLVRRRGGVISAERSSALSQSSRAEMSSPPSSPECRSASPGRPVSG